ADGRGGGGAVGLPGGQPGAVADQGAGVGRPVVQEDVLGEGGGVGRLGLAGHQVGGGADEHLVAAVAAHRRGGTLPPCRVRDQPRGGQRDGRNRGQPAVFQGF